MKINLPQQYIKTNLKDEKEKRNKLYFIQSKLNYFVYIVTQIIQFKNNNLMLYLKIILKYKKR